MWRRMDQRFNRPRLPYDALQNSCFETFLKILTTTIFVSFILHVFTPHETYESSVQEMASTEGLQVD